MRGVRTLGLKKQFPSSKCFPPRGQRPFTYLGERILPLENMEGGDVHSIADMALAEQLLKQQDWEHARKPLE